ncbi:DUF559 domain-containing protein, partial [Candidatus Shapirobacteria bacterium]|nr:DUF559 domain-containing protein [Candidatus Shapirobacteria bacterium]
MKYTAPEEARTQVGNLRYLEELRLLSKRQRNKSTLGEIIFWQKIKGDALGYRFLRQKPVGRFIADFYCSKLTLVIEIDGEYHKRTLERDKGRDLYFVQRGINTVRFDNQFVLDNTGEAVNQLRTIITTREKELSLSSKGDVRRM